MSDIEWDKYGAEAMVGQLVQSEGSGATRDAWMWLVEERMRLTARVAHLERAIEAVRNRAGEIRDEALDIDVEDIDAAEHADAVAGSILEALEDALAAKEPAGE